MSTDGVLQDQVGFQIRCVPGSGTALDVFIQASFQVFHLVLLVRLQEAEPSRPSEPVQETNPGLQSLALNLKKLSSAGNAVAP